MSGKPGNRDFIPVPVVTGECPTMCKAARGMIRVLSGFKEASHYLKTRNKNSLEILVTTEIDWSWTRILEHFLGVITNRGTRVSRGAEVLVIMNKPGVLGTKNATEMLHSGTGAHIVCNGNKASVYLLREKPEARTSVLALH
jgi:phosphoenolpyruvate synthase/pyruvate phosphate dikinase